MRLTVESVWVIGAPVSWPRLGLSFGSWIWGLKPVTRQTGAGRLPPPSPSGAVKPFFSSLDTLPQGRGACLPFFEILGAISGITSPPPGGGRPRVGWDFLGKIFVTKIFISPLSSGLPDLVSTLAVLYYICNPGVLGSNLGSNLGR